MKWPSSSLTILTLRFTAISKIKVIRVLWDIFSKCFNRTALKPWAGKRDRIETDRIGIEQIEIGSRENRERDRKEIGRTEIGTIGSRERDVRGTERIEIRKTEKREKKRGRID